MVLSGEQAEEVLRTAGVQGPVGVTLVKRSNDVWRLDASGSSFFLKVFTKPWYGGDILDTAFCVEHEAGAWARLAGQGLAVPEVVATRMDADNPLGRPFLLTRQLRGAPLPDQLRDAMRTSEASLSGALLRVTGEYLRHAHAITFAYPGYVTFHGPSEPPDPDGWQHRSWSAARRQADALEDLEKNAHHLPVPLVVKLRAEFSTMTSVLAADYAPPRFIFGDCHAHQFFVYRREDGSPAVSGFVDMEVASAGDPGEDLLKFGIEMAGRFPVATRWWEPLFDGYGGAPDFARFKLRMLGASEVEFRIFGNPGSRAELLTRLYEARDWQTLFRAVAAPAEQRS